MLSIRARWFIYGIFMWACCCLIVIIPVAVFRNRVAIIFAVLTFVLFPFVTFGSMYIGPRVFRPKKLFGGFNASDQSTVPASTHPAPSPYNLDDRRIRFMCADNVNLEYPLLKWYESSMLIQHMIIDLLEDNVVNPDAETVYNINVIYDSHVITVLANYVATEEISVPDSLEKQIKLLRCADYLEITGPHNMELLIAKVLGHGRNSPVLLPARTYKCAIEWLIFEFNS